MLAEWTGQNEQGFAERDQSWISRGVCVANIQEKSGLAQSVISTYLSSMQKIGLLESRRFGQWTYYRRNEEAIDNFLEDFTAGMQVKKR